MQEDEVLVSFDVKSLFTSEPVEEALKAVRKRPVEDDNLKEKTGFNVGTVMHMLTLCLQTRQFQFREKHCELVDGLAMGALVSSLAAIIFMADFETEALESFKGSGFGM